MQKDEDVDKYYELIVQVMVDFFDWARQIAFQLNDSQKEISTRILNSTKEAATLTFQLKDGINAYQKTRDMTVLVVAMSNLNQAAVRSVETIEDINSYTKNSDVLHLDEIEEAQQLRQDIVNVLGQFAGYLKHCKQVASPQSEELLKQHAKQRMNTTNLQNESADATVVLQEVDTDDRGVVITKTAATSSKTTSTSTDNTENKMQQPQQPQRKFTTATDAAAEIAQRRKTSVMKTSSKRPAISARGTLPAHVLKEVHLTDD